uniref:Uncharacterized protein n=1 Tax=Manihot esculenta TaxID=3983 RepID=A0A2C9UDI9_MANES
MKPLQNIHAVQKIQKNNQGSDGNPQTQRIISTVKPKAPNTRKQGCKGSQLTTAKE